jgi:hypothetical protein
MDYSDLDAVAWPYQLTAAVHCDMYPALDPARPELSAEGKMVLITSVSGGVGKAGGPRPCLAWPRAANRLTDRTF